MGNRENYSVFPLFLPSNLKPVSFVKACYEKIAVVIECCKKKELYSMYKKKIPVLGQTKHHSGVVACL